MSNYKIWWIPQVPMKAFEVPVPDVSDPIAMAGWMLRTLADYDKFQYENNVKPDYCNAGGLLHLDEDGEWSEWNDEDGNDISECIANDIANDWLDLHTN